jgi:hypothetical protein
MSPWKYRFRSLAPQRSDRSVLPAALAGVLALMVVVQLVFAGPVPLPSGVAVPARSSDYAAPPVRQSIADAAILAHPLFAPRQAPSAGGDAAAPRLIEGAQVAGTVAIRGSRRIVVRRADGKIVNLAQGQEIGSWRLVDIGDSSATFTRNGQRVAMAYSAAQAAAPAAEETAEQ